MLNRWIGIATALLMISVNVALFMRDVAPAWIAGEPPGSFEADLAELGIQTRRTAQVAILNGRDRRVGTSWTIAQREADRLTISSVTELRFVNLPIESGTHGTMVTSKLTVTPDGRPDKFHLLARGLGVFVELNGEYVPPNEFVIVWKLDELRGNLLLNAAALKAFGDIVRPFDRLPGLYVGRSWRVELFNPLTQLLPGWRGETISTDSLLVRVTRTEKIEHAGETVEAFVVETDRVVAWVHPDGRVLRQEVDVPLIGKLKLIDEPFDQDSYDEVRGPKGGGL